MVSKGKTIHQHLAGETKTVSDAKGSKSKLRIRDRVETPTPILNPDQLYWADDVRRSFGVSIRSFGDWKRRGLVTICVPAGELVYGHDAIEFLREHRRKSAVASAS